MNKLNLSQNYNNLDKDQTLYLSDVFEYTNLHKGPVLSIISLNRNKIISGGEDGTIKVWLNENGDKVKCVNTLLKHSGKVLCLLKLNEFTFSSGSDDQTLNIWCGFTDFYYCVNTFELASQSVCLLKLNDKSSICGLQDGSIQIWNFENKLDNFPAHKESVLCLINFDNNRFFSGSKDTFIKAWNKTDNTFIKSMNNINPVITLIKLNDSTIVSGCRGKTLKIWNADNYACVLNVLCNEPVICSLRQSDTIFVNGIENDSLSIMEMNAGCRVRYEKKISCMAICLTQFKEDYIAIGCVERSVILVKLNKL